MSMYLTHDRIRHSSSANSLNGLSSPKILASQKTTKSHAKNTSSKVKTQAIVKSLVNTEQKFQAMSL